MTRDLFAQRSPSTCQSCGEPYQIGYDHGCPNMVSAARRIYGTDCLTDSFRTQPCGVCLACVADDSMDRPD